MSSILSIHQYPFNPYLKGNFITASVTTDPYNFMIQAPAPVPAELSCLGHTEHLLWLLCCFESGGRSIFSRNFISSDSKLDVSKMTDNRLRGKSSFLSFWANQSSSVEWDDCFQNGFLKAMEPKKSPPTTFIVFQVVVTHWPTFASVHELSNLGPSYR